MSDLNWSKCNQWHSIGDGIKWRNQKHWGMMVWAGEGRYDRKDEGIEDRSGCLSKDCIVTAPLDAPGRGCKLVMDMCSGPVVVEWRKYVKGKKEISAVLSYPNGIGAQNSYFWEISPSDNNDIERFDDERKMEIKIRRLLTNKGGGKKMRWPRTKEELEGIRSRAFWLGVTVGGGIFFATQIVLEIIGG